jgi:peptidoglycan/LPS O-acetylase OafA/YrhL
LHLSRVIYVVCSLQVSFSASCNNVIKFIFQRNLIVGWTLAILCNCSVFFGLAYRHLPSSLSVLYVAFSRTGWALGIAWLVFACSTNHDGKSIFFKSLINTVMSFFLLTKYSLWNAKYLTFCKLHSIIFDTFAGIVNKVLLLDIFVTLGKLTYGVYLVNNSAQRRTKEVGNNKLF